MALPYHVHSLVQLRVAAWTGGARGARCEADVDDQHSLRSSWLAVADESDSSLVPGDKLIGALVEVGADQMRLRAYSQNIVPYTLDQRRLPPAATAPRVSHVWQAIRQNRNGSAPSSFST